MGATRLGVICYNTPGLQGGVIWVPQDGNKAITHLAFREGSYGCRKTRGSSGNKAITHLAFREGSYGCRTTRGHLGTRL